MEGCVCACVLCVIGEGAACAEGGERNAMQPVRIWGLGLTLLEGRASTAPELFLDGQVGGCVGWCVGVEGERRYS
jgi:hypothetical protein